MRLILHHDKFCNLIILSQYEKWKHPHSGSCILNTILTFIPIQNKIGTIFSILLKQHFKWFTLYISRFSIKFKSKLPFILPYRLECKSTRIDHQIKKGKKEKGERTWHLYLLSFNHLMQLEFFASHTLQPKNKRIQTVRCYDKEKFKNSKTKAEYLTASHFC